MQFVSKYKSLRSRRGIWTCLQNGSHFVWTSMCQPVEWARFKSVYKLINLGALKSSLLNKPHLSMYGYLWNSTQNTVPVHWKVRFFIQCWKIKSSQTYKLICVFETPLWFRLASILLMYGSLVSCMSSTPNALKGGFQRGSMDSILRNKTNGCYY